MCYVDTHNKSPPAMRVVLLVLLAVASGCTSPRLLSAPPAEQQTQDAVNAALDGQRVRVELRTGETADHAMKVSLANDSLYFTPNQPRRVRRAVHLDEVSRLSYVRGRGTGKGALIGAAPGVLYVALFALSDSIWREVGIGMGLIATVVYGGIGGLIGQAVSPGERVIIYEARIRLAAPQEEPGGAASG